MVGGMCGKASKVENWTKLWMDSLAEGSRYHDSDYQVIQHDILNPV